MSFPSPFLLLLSACSAEPEPAPPPPPTVMVVVLDTLRADRLGAYGHGRPLSNQLDAVAASGVLFEDVTAPSIWTWPSHASLFTGRYPWEHGARAGTGSGGPTVMRTDLPTLAEAFSAAGYDTVALSANSWLCPDLGLVRGFARAECETDDAEIIRRATETLAAPRDAPLFLFVNLLTAHAPYMVQPGVPFSARHAAALRGPEVPDWAAPWVFPEDPGGLSFDPPFPGDPELSGEQAYNLGLFDLPQEGVAMVDDLYDGGVAGVDASLKVLVEAWNQGGHGQGIFAVTSDHGEALGDGHRLGHWGRFGRDVLQVPLAIAAPGRLPAGTRVDAPVSLRRLGATLQDLAGLPGPHPDSLRPVIGGADPGEAPMAALWLDDQWQSRDPTLGPGAHVFLRDGDLGMVVHGDDVRVYDWVSDGAFTADRAADHTDRLPAWRERARAAVAATPETATVPLDGALRDQLKALGYLD